ncbi:hypothetical protein GP486_002302 [Trichoglossum hirsutum]|uniref:L-ornithine N(5)-oxygenase n=1 Tax=Trichoglossum hirsutum TaxID=265104 RepID=A0A9P8LFC0_9PEZI|nr:hypothetical protein GP486_002302 [Trichoglossum hirsutum]
MAIQLQRKLKFTGFEIYEKYSRVGGTWAKAVQPNAGCDIASHFYSYSFALSPDWKSTYGSQDEIQAYIENTLDAAKPPVKPKIRLLHEVLSATWAGPTDFWIVRIKNLQTGNVFEKKAKVVITAVGVLDIPNTVEDIPGLQSWRDVASPNTIVVHTATWETLTKEAVSYGNLPHEMSKADRERAWMQFIADKNIVVVGNGCSANQVVPWLVKAVESSKRGKVTQFVRSPHWVVPKTNRKISDTFRWCLRYISFFNRLYRWYIAVGLDLKMLTFRRTSTGSRQRRKTEDSIKQYMVSTAPEKYHETLIPRYEFGQKRPVMDHGWLESMKSEKFELISGEDKDICGITNVGGEGGEAGTVLLTKNDRRIPVDVLVLATGFKTQELLMPIQVRGEDGLALNDVWRKTGGPEAYMGTSVSKFPNLFLLTGPNTLPTDNSTLVGIENSIIYIIRLLRCLLPVNGRPPRFASISPTEDAQRSYNEWIREKLAGLVYDSKVRNWYTNYETGKNTLVWPGSQLAWWWRTCWVPVRWQDYVKIRAKTECH